MFYLNSQTQKINKYGAIVQSKTNNWLNKTGYREKHKINKGKN